MLKKILLALDGSGFAEQALPYATALAGKFGAELIVLRATYPGPMLTTYPNVYEVIVAEDQRATMTYMREIKELLANMPFPVRVVPLLNLPAAEAIIDYACQEQVDLIVMTTHGRSGLDRWFYGSVAQKVLQQAPCPVFLVRATERLTPQLLKQTMRSSEAVFVDP